MKRVKTYSELEENTCYYLVERVPYHQGGGRVTYEHHEEPFYLKEKKDDGIEIVLISAPTIAMAGKVVGKAPVEFVQVYLPLAGVFIDTSQEPPKNRRCSMIFAPRKEEKAELLTNFVSLRVIEKIEYRDPDLRKRERATFGYFKMP